MSHEPSGLITSDATPKRHCMPMLFAVSAALAMAAPDVQSPYSTSSLQRPPMHTFDLEADAPIRLTATARPDGGRHRWRVELMAASDGAVRLTFGSWIDGRDLHQTIQIPAQDVDCRLEVGSRHQSADGWREDRLSRGEDRPHQLQIGFCDDEDPGARADDVLLSFDFAASGPRPEGRLAHS